MDERINNNNENQANSIENKIGEYFSDLKLNNNQINKIKELLTKELEQTEEQQTEDYKKNIKIKEKKLLKKYKKILEESTNTDEGIKKIENELTEIENELTEIETKNSNLILKNENKYSIKIKGIYETNYEDTEGIKIKTNNKIENQEKTNELDGLLKKTSESYAKLNEKYKTTNPQELEEKKSNLSEETKKKLEENNIKIDDYVQYILSRDKINELGGNDNTKETRDFLKNLKNLEDNLGIRNETLQGLALTPDKKTFEDNPDLQKFKDNDPEIAKLKNTSYFGKEEIDLSTKSPEELKQIISPYQKMEKIYKDQRDFPKDDKFQEISKKIGEQKFNELKQEDLNYYTSSLDKLNGWITDYAEASAALAPQTGILKYLDSYTGLDKYSHQDMFGKIDKEYIKNKDNTMCINGIINGNPLSFYYNTKDGQTKISCDDILHIENDQYQIYNGEGEKPKSDLRINMPSMKDIVENIQSIEQSTYTKLLEGSSDINEFQKKITELINGRINRSFPQNEEIKTRMSRFAEKNLAAQTFDSVLIGRAEFKKKINEQKDVELTPIKKVLLLVDNTTEKSTATELQEFRTSMKKLEGLIGRSWDEIKRIKDPLLKDNVLKLKHVKENQNYEEREKSIIEFFSLFERKDPKHQEYKIDIDDFSSFIDLGFKDEETKKTTIDNFTPEFQTEYSKKIIERNKMVTKKGDEEQIESGELAYANLMEKLEEINWSDENYYG